jgi:hypothetical protein
MNLHADEVDDAEDDKTISDFFDVGRLDDTTIISTIYF